MQFFGRCQSVPNASNRTFDTNFEEYKREVRDVGSRDFMQSIEHMKTFIADHYRDGTYYGPRNLVSVSNSYVPDNNVTRNNDNNPTTVVFDMGRRSSIHVNCLQDVVPDMGQPMNATNNNSHVAVGTTIDLTEEEPVRNNNRPKRIARPTIGQAHVHLLEDYLKAPTLVYKKQKITCSNSHVAVGTGTTDKIEDDDETYAEQRNRIRQSKQREEMYLKDSQRTEERAKFLQKISERKSCTNNEKNKSIKVRELNICEDTLAQLVDEQERLEKEQIRIKQEIVYNLQRQESIRRELAVETINNDPLNNTKTPAKYVTEDRNPLAKNNTDDRKPSGEKQQKKSVLN